MFEKTCPFAGLTCYEVSKLRKFQSSAIEAHGGGEDLSQHANHAAVSMRGLHLAVQQLDLAIDAGYTDNDCGCKQSGVSISDGGTAYRRLPFR